MEATARETERQRGRKGGQREKDQQADAEKHTDQKQTYIIGLVKRVRKDWREKGGCRQVERDRQTVRYREKDILTQKREPPIKKKERRKGNRVAG